ncbi:hydrogen peroxide-inducible genes activator [Rhodosalinus sp.]|uniref:hydrogen peroxide-inducible genes activator n=1 Tax=Rhodosalinus sp. TaxID=2047741 RepID=UPI00397E6ED4
MNITLRQLAYFKALAEHRNFGRAAEAVHVSQPALSVQIRELERTLGAALVERQTRELVLTPFGRVILNHAERVLGAVEGLALAARWREGLRGQLRLGMIPTIAPYILPEALARLRARDIALDVQVQEGKTGQLLESLRSGALDVAVMALPAGAEGMEEHLLFEDRFLLAGSAARLAGLDEAATLRPEGLGDGQFLLLEDGHCLTDQTLEVCGRSRGHAQINMGASSLATLCRLVGAGFGLTLIPELAVAAECRAVPDMVVRRFAAPEPSRQVGLVKRRGSLDSAATSELAGLLAEAGEAALEEARGRVAPLRAA